MEKKSQYQDTPTKDKALSLTAATDSRCFPCILGAHMSPQADSAQSPYQECPHPPSQGKEQIIFARSAKWLLKNI